MFGSPGVAYVYLVYGMYHCLNVVVEAEGLAAAVLIRAVEPIRGLVEMRAARSAAAVARAAGRGKTAVEAAARRIEAMPAARLAGGPGLVCAAFSIERAQNGRDLCDAGADLRLELGDSTPPAVEAGPRIGIDYADEPWLSLPWRFFVAGSPSLSTGSRR
jgi:DNA-3-methyladenine glycosylase